jgi:hypothetical protein
MNKLTHLCLLFFEFLNATNNNNDELGTYCHPFFFICLSLYKEDDDKHLAHHCPFFLLFVFHYKKDDDKHSLLSSSHFFVTFCLQQSRMTRSSMIFIILSSLYVCPLVEKMTISTQLIVIFFLLLFVSRYREDDDECSLLSSSHFFGNLWFIANKYNEELCVCYHQFLCLFDY